MLDDVGEAYFAWHASRLKRQVLEDEYDRACGLVLGRGLYLKLMYEDRDSVCQFLTNHGVMEGPARRIVRDVEAVINHSIRNETE